MTETKTAVALRPINHDRDHHPKGAIIRGMTACQFSDWQGAGLVREATADELKAADGETAPAPKPKRASTRKAKTAAQQPAGEAAPSADGSAA